MRLAEELKRNEKERAEHVMLVDLGRNDVGRVCEYGSVRVPQFMGLERFSHVMHLTSIVEGQLADDRDRLDALVSCFPGRHGVGRAEGPRDADHPRARAVGPRALRGRRRLSRFRRQSRFLHRDPHRHHVGRQGATCRPARGSSWTRIPAAEYEETRDKARALLRALELAQRLEHADAS